jgi:hypothetical protein
LGCTSRATSSRSSSAAGKWKLVEPDKKFPDIRLIGRARPRCSQTIARVGHVSVSRRRAVPLIVAVSRVPPTAEKSSQASQAIDGRSKRWWHRCGTQARGRWHGSMAAFSAFAHEVIMVL